MLRLLHVLALPWSARARTTSSVAPWRSVWPRALHAINPFDPSATQEQLHEGGIEEAPRIPWERGFTADYTGYGRPLYEREHGPPIGEIRGGVGALSTDNTPFSSFAAAVGKGDRKAADSMFQALEREHDPEDIYGEAVRCISHNRLLVEALHEDMKLRGAQPSVNVFNHWLRGCRRDANAMNGVLQRMKHANVPRNHETYVEAIVACGKRFEKARRMVQAMERDGLRPTTFVYEAQLHVCAVARSPHAALQVLREMQERHVELSENAFLLLFRAAYGHKEYAELFFEEMVQSGVAPTSRLMNAVVWSLVETPQESETFLFRLLDEAKPDALTIDAAVWAISDSAQAWVFMHRAEAHYVEPDVWNLNAMAARWPSSIQNVLFTMNRLDISPNAVTAALMLLALKTEPREWKVTGRRYFARLRRSEAPAVRALIKGRHHLVNSRFLDLEELDIAPSAYFMLRTCEYFASLRKMHLEVPLRSMDLATEETPQWFHPRAQLWFVHQMMRGVSYWATQNFLLHLYEHNIQIYENTLNFVVRNKAAIPFMLELVASDFSRPTESTHAIVIDRLYQDMFLDRGARVPEAKVHYYEIKDVPSKMGARARWQMIEMYKDDPSFVSSVFDDLIECDGEVGIRLVSHLHKYLPVHRRKDALRYAKLKSTDPLVTSYVDEQLGDDDDWSGEPIKPELLEEERWDREDILEYKRQKSFSSIKDLEEHFDLEQVHALAAEYRQRKEEASADGEGCEGESTEESGEGLQGEPASDSRYHDDARPLELLSPSPVEVIERWSRARLADRGAIEPRSGELGSEEAKSEGDAEDERR